MHVDSERLVDLSRGNHFTGSPVVGETIKKTILRMLIYRKIVATLQCFFLAPCRNMVTVWLSL